MAAWIFWINCAGVAITKKILDLDVEDYDMVMETNLRSVLFASKAAAAVMKASEKGGKIINIASVGGLKRHKRTFTLRCLKAGVINLTKTMALNGVVTVSRQTLFARAMW